MGRSRREVQSSASDFLRAVHAAVEAGYPRPRLVRDRWTDLCGPWQFAFDDDDVGRDAGWQEPGAPDFDGTIELPYPFESKRSGVGDAGSHPIAWYRRRVRLPERGHDERVVVHFGAVDYTASVFCDGRLLAQHTGGHTPFACALPAGVGEEACLVVRVEDGPAAIDQPRGKQDWRPEAHSVWYGRTSGIWQPVWLEVVPAVHLEAVDFVADVAGAQIRWRARLSRPFDGSLRLRLSMAGALVADALVRVAGRDVSGACHVPPLANPLEWEHLEWSPEHPRLFGAELALLDASGAPVDSALSYLGVREVSAADGQFLLNRRPYRLQLVLEQGYWPDTRLAAPTREALREEVELIKSLGFNGARLHQKIEDPVFLYWCDRLGLLVWEEMPSIPAFSPSAAGRMIAEWSEVIERDRSHACVVVWVPFNESWGVPAVATSGEQASLVAALADLTRALDPTRLVVSNDGWEHVDSDLLTIHDYAPEGASLALRYGDAAARQATLDGAWPAVRCLVVGRRNRPGLPVVLSEFGGVALPEAPDLAWHGHSEVADAAELEERLVDLFGAVHRCDGLAGFCYTQLSDTEQESNGLTWSDRKPKLPSDVIAAIVSGARTASAAD